MKKAIDFDPSTQDISQLQAMVQTLLAERDEWEKERQSLSAQYQSLLEQFKLAIDRQFAKRAESLKPYNDAQGELFNEVECEADTPAVESHEASISSATEPTAKRRGKRKPLPKDLPRERIVLDLEADEKICPCCQGELHKIGEDVSEKLEFIPAQLKVLEYVRPRYGCRQCEKTAEQVSIIQKPAPASLIPKSFATESLLANIILGKYQYALPLYRQETLFEQAGIALTRTTMARWAMQVSEAFTPLYQAIRQTLLQQVVIQADETPLNVLKEDKQCYMWVYCSGGDSPGSSPPGLKNIVLFDYQNSRAGACPANYLGDFTGYLQTDGYQAYDTLKAIEHLGCMAHARRKFMDAKKVQGKGKTGKADVVLAKIQKLYALEARLKECTVEARQAERQLRAKPMLDDLYQWLNKQKVIGSGQLGKAIKYTLGQWPKLIRYVEDGHLSIDNNRAERAIKSLVIGRKNWLFADTPSGADASAVLYSIIETAKANDLVVYDYLVHCMKALAKPEPDINALLPWNFSH
ncbi:transposase [Photobacterium proteolyticum]|uniref:Transposase n=1 Tax=Photobacterium proteolyticum TaxID=1903952 RepID=A0A1Q9H7M2_9GAMM|nr:IS66 family transposase [Photobacterium proteolyticum]OLQ83800.1 transposase [Photobacterium proteolyticum]